jgi:dTDP-4-amino-4,6-dideoxygalactose transaminase
MKFIPLASPDIREEDINCVVNVLKSGMLVQGKKVEELESTTKEFLKTENVVATSNGTSTMHLALVALGVGVGDEVIVPAFSYIATANVVELVGATPIFVDVDLDSFNIDVTKIEKAITTKTKAIIPVHEFGLACDIESIIKIAKKHSLFVIEDAACALGATYKGKHVGTFGDFGSFSLHPRKAITSGEGGLLIAKTKSLDKKTRILRNHGIDIINGKMEFIEAGFNYRLTDIQATLVNSQFNRLDKNLIKKEELAQVYLKTIKNPTIKLPSVSNNSTHTWQTFHVLMSSEQEREKAIIQLREKGIGSNYGAQCIPEQKYYLKKYNLDVIKLFPNATKAYKQGLAIPLYEKLSIKNILYIAEELNNL